MIRKYELDDNDKKIIRLAADGLLPREIGKKIWKKATYVSGRLYKLRQYFNAYSNDNLAEIVFGSV